VTILKSLSVHVVRWLSRRRVAVGLIVCALLAAFALGTTASSDARSGTSESTTMLLPMQELEQSLAGLTSLAPSAVDEREQGLHHFKDQISNLCRTQQPLNPNALIAVAEDESLGWQLGAIRSMALSAALRQPGGQALVQDLVQNPGTPTGLRWCAIGALSEFPSAAFLPIVHHAAESDSSSTALVGRVNYESMLLLDTRVGSCASDYDRVGVIIGHLAVYCMITEPGEPFDSDSMMECATNRWASRRLTAMDPSVVGSALASHAFSELGLSGEDTYSTWYRYQAQERVAMRMLSAQAMDAWRFAAGPPPQTPW